MRRIRPLVRSAGFRYALVYMVLFAVSVSGVLGLVYGATVGVIGRQTDATVEAEITGLREHYREGGLQALIQIIQERSAGNPGRRGLYMLADQDFDLLAGNLPAWPNTGRISSGWIDFTVDVPNNDGVVPPRVARARVFLLPEGLRLLVGRDTTERSDFRHLFTEALVGALGLTFALSLLGGLLTSRYLLSRIDAINRTSRVILAGDLKQRMPVSGSGDEFDQLANNLNAMLDQIERLMAGMREVSNSIAHDLRSPISRLRSRLEVTLMSRTDLESYRDALVATIGEADGILATFNALLRIALAESGALRDSFEPVDLAAIAEDAAELYEPVAEEKGLAFRTYFDAALPAVGNRHLLSQAVANLLDNAIKYTPAGGTVTLAAWRGEHGLQISVADSGPGIPPEHREKVLERFVRLDSSRSQPGSGLGLALVAAVAHLHDIRLRLEDNRPGLRVVLEFPGTLAASAGPAAAGPRAAAGSRPADPHPSGSAPAEAPPSEALP